MTSPQSDRPTPPPQNSGLAQWGAWFRRPSTLIIGGVIVALGTGGYFAGQQFAYRRVSPWLQTELSKSLQRSVKIGQVEEINFNQVRLGPSSLPATANDNSTINIKGIEININPLLFLVGKPIEIEARIISPRVILQQNAKGEWINLNLHKGEGKFEIPLDVKVKLKLEDAQVKLTPYVTQKPILINLEGTGRYQNSRQKKQQEVGYDLNVKLQQSQLQAKGNTIIETGETQTELKIQQLNLPELVSLIPNFPIKVSQGQLNGNVQVNSPGFEKLEETKTLGSVALANLQAKIDALKVPLLANFNLDLQGQKINIQRGEIALGKLRTQLTGGIDWRRGYSLALQTNVIEMGDLFNALAIAVPLPTTGKLQAKFQLTGKLENPLLIGKIENLNPLTLDKIQIQSFQTNLRGTLDLLTLPKIEIKPQAGGKIEGKAELQLGLLKSLKKNQPVSWEKMPVNLQLAGQLPSQKLLQPYPIIPNDVRLGDLDLNGKISGLLGQPIIRVKWHDRAASSIAKVSIRNQGEALSLGSNFVLQNRLTNGKKGEILINAKGDFRQDQWQTSLQAKEFLVSPWVDFLCTQEFKVCPDQLRQDTWTIANGKIELAGSLARLNPSNLKGQGQLLIRSQADKINLQMALAQGQLKTAITANQVNLNPYLNDVTVPVKLQRLQSNISLPLSPIWHGQTIPFSQVKIAGKVNLEIANQPLNAEVNLQREFLTFGANLSPFSLNPFFPQLPVKTELVAGKIQLATQIKDIQTVNWNSLSGHSNVQLKVANSPLSVQSNVSQGQLTAIAQVGKINLQKFIAALTFPTQLNQGKVTLLARLEDVLKPQPNLQNLEAIADVQLAVAGGTVQSNSRLKQNQWQSFLQIQQIQPHKLGTNAALNSLSPINGNLALSGNINSLLNSSNSLPITINNSKLRSGQQSAEVKGNLVVDQLFKHPQLAQVNLGINSHLNLANLPVNQTVAHLPITESLRPESVNLGGIAHFQGQLTGRNVTDLSQINLQGQTTVQNLALNQEKFEPNLIGSLKLQGTQKLQLKLKGREDQIALELKGCSQKPCLFAYVPDYFLVKHQYQTGLPIMAEGQRQGDNFHVKIEQFPLALLNLQPGKAYNLPGTLNGDLQAQFAFDLDRQRGEGSLSINQLALGALQTDEIAANFNYKANILKLNDTYVRLGKSRYDFDASLNLKTLEVQSRLQIAEGKVQDLLTALRISDVESLSYLFQPNAQNTAKNLPYLSLGNAQDPLQNQVNLLYKVDQEIRKWAAKYEQGGIPNELNFEGLFDAEIRLSGNLTAPELAVQLKGKNWSWYPQPAIANIIPPLGLVMTNTRFLPIQAVNLQAELKEGVLTVNPSELVIKDSRLALAGNFSLEQNSAIWSVSNLSLDTIGTFVKLPSEITGSLNAQGGITGTLTNPQIRGDFDFADVAVNARPLNQVIAGQFNYNEAHLEVITDRESPLFFYTKIPFAVSQKDKNIQKAEKVDQFEMQIKAKKEALTLIGALTQEQVSWVSGDGEINLKAEGELRFDKEISLADFEAKGNISLKDVVLSSPILPQPVTVSGDIILDNKTLKVESFEGIFAQGKLSLMGNLPLFVSSPEIDDPLTLRLNKTKIDIPNLYEGEAEGIVIFNGTAFSPNLTGGIRLANGQIFVPDAPEGARTEMSPLKIRNWLKPRRNQQPLLNPNLNNFKITLDNLFVQQTPLYDFAFGGELLVNGSLANWSQLKPRGQILLSRGRVSFLDTRFLLDRRYRNQISFVPDQGILNPNLDIKMRTIVSELPQSKRLRSGESNEIPDDTLNQVQRIDINLGIDGPLTQLLPNLNQAQIDTCNQEKQFRPLRGTAKLSEWRMKQAAMCLRVLAAQGLYDEQIFRNPGIRLTSNPARSQGEIVRLLGEQFIVLADAIQGKNSGQLLQYGITQLAIPMIFQGTIYDIETSVSNSLGTTDFRVVPFLEAIYQVEDKAFVRLSYDYSFNEVKVRYEKQF